MKARILGLMTTGTILSLATGVGAQSAPAATEQPKVVSAQAAVLTVVTPERADKMGRDLLRNPDPKRAGPGTEGSTTSVYVDAATGKQYLVAVYMASADREVHPAKALMTIRCASYEFQEKEAPKLIADTEIQAQEGRRTAHRPGVPERLDSKGRLPIFYGNDYMQNSPSTYVKVVDYKCNLLSSPKRVSLDYMFDDANSGGPGYVASYTAPNGQVRYIGNYLATNGNKDTRAEGAEAVDDDITYAFNGAINDQNEWEADWPETPADQMLQYTQTITDNTTKPPTVTVLNFQIPAKNNPRPMSSMTDIGRGARIVTMIDDKRFAWCTPYGNNRPSDKIECGVALAQSGKVLWRGFVLEGSEKIDYRHWNQSTIAKFGANRIALHALAGNGAGKNTDMKGTSMGETFIFDIVGDALVKNTFIRGAASHQPHSGICAGKRGVDGQEKDTIAIASAAHTGIGRSALTFVAFDEGAKTLTFDDRKDRVATAWFGDGQFASNMYGENPMEQGRDFPKCQGDVPNPSYGKDGGWLKDVKTFFVNGVHGRQPGSSRNAFWLSLIPAVTKYPVGSFSNPVVATEALSTPPAGDPTPVPAPSSDSSSGCACSTPGQTSAPTFAGGLLLLGLAIGGIAARRRS